jgi:mono/diheme cytochrome c family protein
MVGRILTNPGDLGYSQNFFMEETMHKTKLLSFGLPTIVIVGLLAVFATPAGARAPAQFDNPVEQGKYLTTIAGCVDCHTPRDEQFRLVRDKEFSGGQPFELGPLGTVFSKNLTSDKETGLGDWTDEEIKIAFQTGVSKDGLHLFPIMPYRFFNSLSDSDADAIVAYLRTLAPISNKVPRTQILPAEQLPPLPRQTGVVAPAPSDTAARGKYLMTALIACTDCHTPVDPATGQPVEGKYLAGGQPFEGPWGIVYGGNLTPDKETGLGNWSDADIARVLHQGIRPDRRVVVLMPWEIFQPLTDEDTKAIIYYLRNDIPAVHNEVPAAKLNEGFENFAPPEKVNLFTPLNIAIAVAGVLIIAGGLALLLRRRPPSPAS